MGWRRGHTERGASTLEYVGVLALVAVLAAGVLFAFPNMASDIRGAVSTAVCQITGGDCEPSESTASGDTDEPGVGAEGDGSSRQPPADPPRDSDGVELSGPYDQDRVADALDLIDDYLDPSFCLWPFCRRPNLSDVIGELEGLSPAELQAVFDQLSDEELEQLLGPPGLGGWGHDMQEFVLQNASMDTIRRLMGMDPPYFTADHSAVGNSDAQNAEYGEIPGATLFGPDDSIELSDINQGLLSDCWFMASMGMMTQSEEGQQMIRDMITENPNGTFTVTFPDGVEVTVTPDFPLRANGSPAFAGVGDPPKLWAAVLEEAAAQRRGGYHNLEVNSVSFGVELLTGQEATSHRPDSLSMADLERMHDSGEAIAFLTPPAEDAEGPLYGDSAPAGERLTAFHFYVVEEVNAEDGTVSLYNPWGNSHRTVAYEDIEQHFSGIQSVNLTN